MARFKTTFSTPGSLYRLGILPLLAVLAVISLASCGDDEVMPIGFYPKYSFNVNAVSIDGHASDDDDNIGHSALCTDDDVLELSSSAHEITVKTAILFQKEYKGRIALLSPNELMEISSQDSYSGMSSSYYDSEIKHILIQNKNLIRIPGSDESFKLVDLEKSAENTCTGDGVTVEKSVSDGYVYFTINLPENNNDYTRRITLYLMGDKQDYNPANEVLTIGGASIDYNTTITIDQKAAR